MPIIYKGQPHSTLEELRVDLKAGNRERAKKIPELLRQKELEYV